MSYTPITIKYSTANSTPVTLNVAEPAYSYASNTLFIGTENGDGAIAVGGQYYVVQQQVIFNTVNSAFIAANSAATGGGSLYANTAFVAANSAGVYANAAFAAANTKLSSSGGTISGDLTIAGNIIPSPSVTYNLGSPTNRFKDLYLSGTTINLGNAQIQSDATSGGILLIPTPTANVPNPTALFISSNGSLTTIQTTGGVVTQANLTQAEANTANSVPVDVKINLAFNQANSGFETANSSALYANSAFAAANSITTNIRGGSF